jgi:glycine oxidase
MQADPIERLIARSSRLHGQWASRLADETGIDTGYRRCGGLYLTTGGKSVPPAQLGPTREDLQRDAARLVRLGVRLEWLTDDDLTDLGQVLGTAVAGGYRLPDEAQLRNPRHLQALVAAAVRHGATLLPGTPALAVRRSGDRLEAVETPSGPVSAGEFCLTAGSWTGGLARQLGYDAPIKPIRGQIVLLKAARRPFEPVINVGLQYLVPRDDGRILVGSTMEDVGFDSSTTATGVRGLLGFALGLAPSLADCAVERAWAGLRPAAADGLPILGRLPDLQNAWIATGHFRNGLTLSTATAELMANLIVGREPAMNLAPFSPERFVTLRGSSAAPRPPATYGA